MGNKHIKNINRKKEELKDHINHEISNKNFLKKSNTQSHKFSSDNRNIHNIYSIHNDKKFSFGPEDNKNNINCNVSDAKTDSNSHISQISYNYSHTSEINKQVKNIFNIKNDKTYTLNELIGTGFYSKVYLSESSANKQYAIKCIKKKNLIKNNAFQLILNEKLILQKLNKIKCKFLIELIETFQDEEKLYLVFPYYQYDLFNLLRCGKINKSLLNENLFKFILAQVYIAISCLHENNVIYRDLKPENIVVNSETGYIKLIDFGLSQDNVTDDSQIKNICGTNQYIPPEVVKGEPYNFNFDWWGYGIFMYEIIYGYPPFRGINQKEIFNKILTEDLYFDPTIKISNETKDLMCYLLHKDPDYRIKSEQIPYHPFFKGVDFEKLANLKIDSPLNKLIKNYSNKNILQINNLNPTVKENFLIDQTIFSDF